jgi:pimeloyl-ACP methyl ester carboxylesterase
VTFVMSKPPHIPQFVLRAMAEERTRNFDLEQRIYDGDVAFPVEPHVAGLENPTLIIWGAEDRSHNPAGAEILHGLLPNSQVILMPGVGHMPMVEQPEECATEYLTFRRSLATSTARQVSSVSMEVRTAVGPVP